MPTLHQVTKATRKLLAIVAILIVIFIVGRIAFGIGVNIKERFFPTPPPVPTVLFGTLPPIDFPSQQTPKLSLTVNTISGTLPQFPNQAKVYKLIKNEATLTSVSDVRKTMASVGFSKDEKALSPTLYQWSDPNTGRVIQFDIVSKNLIMTSDFYHDKDVLLAKSLPNSQDAPALAVSFLSQLNLIPDLDLKQTKVSFFTIQGTSLLPTTSLANAQIVRVDLFQKPIENSSIVYASVDKSPINFLIGSSGFQGKVIEAHFFYQPISIKEFSTYPVKTIDEAFDGLKKDKFYVARIYDQGKNEIGITNVSLGYYINDSPKDYLVPVFIFEGNNGFVAYVPATEDSWIHQQSQNSPTPSQ